LLVVIVTLTWLGVSFWFGGGRKVYYDWQVERMCVVDGGVKVYEKVGLPKTVYEKFEARNWVLPYKAKADSSDEYYYKSETHYVRESNPRVTRTVVQVIRRSDDAVLGEVVRYGRGGGDLPGPWHGSSFLCPDPSKSAGFEKRIFLKLEESE